MKKLLAIALCLVFAAGAADARTFYVDANRPNNNGNGLTAKTAKKTIQAAINVARAGDTIVVAPGTYSPIKTNNKKITIKSTKGAAKTKIVKPAKNNPMIVLVRLGKPYSVEVEPGVNRSSDPYTKGKDTRLTGFLLDGRNMAKGSLFLGVSGGTLKSCSIQRLGRNITEHGAWVAYYATLTGCTILRNNFELPGRCVLDRCRIADNKSEEGDYNSRYSNCLFTGNLLFAHGDSQSFFDKSTLVNCTITENTIYRDVDKAQYFTTGPHLASGSKFYNCILRNNYLAWADWGMSDGEWWYDPMNQSPAIHNVDSGCGYSRTYKNNRDPKFVDAEGGNYRLKKGSPCIDQGAVNAKLMKLGWFGTVDLDGKKRLKGKQIDMGCYEY